MASYSKNDPNYGFSTSQIVSAGNIFLNPYAPNQEERNNPPAANMLFVIDVIASPGYLGVSFDNISLVLEVVQPGDAFFVDHSSRSNWHWDVFNTLTMEWVENVIPTRRLRIRADPGSLLSGVGNGRSFRVGVHAPTPGPLEVKALASAANIEAIASSCEVTIEDLNVDENISGYLR